VGDAPTGGALRRREVGVGIGVVLRRMIELLEVLPADDGRRAFHATYLRTTKAVADALRQGACADPEWVERWDVVFADLYLDALDAALAGRVPPRPWAIAFAAAVVPEPERLPPLRQVLLGMNAHINYDLPQATVAVISPADFDDPAVVELRERDHLAIDRVLAARVRAEDREYEGPRRVVDRVTAPLSRLATRRFLVESRTKVWANARRLDAARREGGGPYAERLRELEELTAARVADLEAPGEVLLRLARRGFGVLLPPTAARRPGSPV
jgi:uncharacterized protein DUF5995